MMDPAGIIIVVSSILPFLLSRLTKKFIFFASFSLLAAVLHGIYLFGPNIIFLLVIIYTVSTVAELVSLTTPLNVFGVKYRYNLNHSYFSSKINLLGVYPIEVSFTWVILKYISFNVAYLISQAFYLPSVWMIATTPLILLSLDLVIDPVAVKVAKMWSWEKGGAYFGIPLRNFLGWYLVGLASSLVFSFIDTDKTASYDFLYILPLFFYALILRNASLIIKLDKVKGVFGLIPGLIWILLGVISLILLYLRQA